MQRKQLKIVDCSGSFYSPNSSDRILNKEIYMPGIVQIPAKLEPEIR
jgi:hypothetical protein